MTPDSRRNYPVLVAEAQTLGSIAVIRSLGRAGYPVHSFSTKADALGFQSRYNKQHAVAPDYRDSSFTDWLREYIRAHSIRAIIPSEDLLLAIRPNFLEFAPLLPYSPTETIVYAGMSKADQAQILGSGKQTGTHMPPHLLLNDSDRIPDTEELMHLVFPVYLKVDGCYAKRRGRSAVHYAKTADEARNKLKKLTASYRKVLMQGYIPGRGVGVFFLIWNGAVRAEFMHMRLHEVPHMGGASSYRQSWFHEGIRSDALAKLRAMRWQGVAMMEYRWDAGSDEFSFLEMNGRFWGSLHLALYAGVDFPALLLDAFHGSKAPVSNIAIRRTSSRLTFPSDVAYVRSRWKDASLGWSRKGLLLLEFLALALDPRVHADLWFPGDRKLYWKALWRYPRNIRFSLPLHLLKIKRTFYHVCKCLGLFSLATILTRRGLRILCYHGFASSDESLFRPALFIRSTTFRKRMKYLREQHYDVRSLGEMCELLREGRLPNRAVVITADDGFYGFYQIAWPILVEYSLPATVYVTSYYGAKKTPVFRLAIQYILWKTAKEELDLAGLSLPLPDIVSVKTEQERDDICWKIIHFAEPQCDETQRGVLAGELALRAGIDDAGWRGQKFSLMSAEEIEQISNSGIDVQLHTHRHCLPENQEQVNLEIIQNKEFLEPLAHNELKHFCYPSGVWSRQHWAWLDALGIKSATTCDLGLNYRDTPLFALKRFLDGENNSQIEFEAELSGFSELLRKGIGLFTKAKTGPVIADIPSQKESLSESAARR